MIVTGVIAVVVLWFVFTVVKKLFGLAVLAILAFGAWMVWNDPALLQQWADSVMSLFD